MKKVLSLILCLALIAGLLPAAGLTALADSSEYTIANDYISVSVSGENGGFVVNTAEGDRLKKSDNNVKLLYHNGEYDTSFVSFRVESNETTNDYIFGGVYGSPSDASRNGVEVTKSADGGTVTAVWGTGDLVFTQTITLPNTASNEHGMVSLALNVQNNGAASAEIRARVLLDTCLGDQDFGIYQITDDSSVTTNVETERIVDTSLFTTMQNFRAVDVLGTPGITAYSVNPVLPYQVAFGHWNNLASSLFDFTPNSSLSFTDMHNEYLTADSANALYYKMEAEGGGDVQAGDDTSLICYYGVYSHQSTPDSSSVAVDVTAPLSLEINDARDDYIRQSAVGLADFSVSVNFENVSGMTLNGLILAVSTTGNLRQLSDSGAGMSGFDFDAYRTLEINYSEQDAGAMINKTLYFEANPTESAAYEKITVGVYKDSVTREKLLGEKDIYILLPGNDGDVPLVSFTSMTPDIVYSSGTRYLFLGVTNEAMLSNTANWNMTAYSVSGGAAKQIPHENITVASGAMTVALTDDIKLAPGSWYLQLEWTDPAVLNGIVPAEQRNVTSPALQFTVSEDIKYKNDAYGVLCVVEYSVNNDEVYRIERFKDEADFTAFKAKTGDYASSDWVELLLILRGEFTMTESVTTSSSTVDKTKIGTYYTATSTKTLVDGEYVVDNQITVNDCIDYEGGTMHVYYKDYKEYDYDKSEIRVEFIGENGELYTSDARTSIWKGVAALTAIEQGTPYSLRKYDQNGNRKSNFTDSTVLLVWPSVYGFAQTISGMIFKLAYGELGVMYKNDGKELGRVLSFTASLNLSFTGAADEREDWEKKGFTYWDKMKAFASIYRNDSLYDYAYNPGHIARTVSTDNLDESGADNKSQQVKAAIMVQDVLFGCGEGLVGVNFNVGVTLKNYIDAMPSLEAKIAVNTINDWAFSIAGRFKLSSFSLEANVSFKSKDNIPIPDSFYVFVGGFKPGLNVDGCGVVWVTGGGGGISNLYDSIFLTQAVPPLKLIMSVSFNIVQVLEARATLSVGLTGISLKAENLKVANTNLVVMKSAQLSLEWYPGINLKASIVVDLLQSLIYGGGYIVLTTDENYENVFFEMFARVQLKIPTSVPLVGGMNLIGIDVGLSSEKIWGALEVLSITLGVTYYWGAGEVDFSSGSKAQPTYPSLLLGNEADVPVYYDEENDQTLYAHFGTNVGLIAASNAEIQSDIISLMDASDAEAKSNYERTRHSFNLGAYTDGNGGIVQISFNASSLADARAKAATIKVGSASDYSLNDFGLFTYGVDTEDASAANANVTYDSVSGKGALSFTVTGSGKFNKLWHISTGDLAAELLLYNVVEPPKVASAGIDGLTADSTTVSWSGSDMSALDSVSFYLTSQSEAEAETAGASADDELEVESGWLLERITDPAKIELGTASFATPAGLPSGNYYVRAVYSQDGVINGTVYSDTPLSYTNARTPAAPAASMKANGNLEYAITISDASNTNVTGYSVSVFKADGSATDVSQQTFDKSESGNTVITLGGSYSFTDPDTNLETSFGLVGGESYYAVITPYNKLDDAIIYGVPATTSDVLLPPMTTPEVSLSASAEPQIFTEESGAETVTTIVYTTSDITFTAGISESATGSWTLDGSRSAEAVSGASVATGGDFTDAASVTMDLSDLDEGGHTLALTGRDAGGDSFRYEYAFTVDTSAPRLMLSSPVNGGFFEENGSLTITGVTDKGALLTVTADGKALCANRSLTTDSSGTFSTEVFIPDAYASVERTVSITVADAVGNSASKEVTLTNGGLASLQKLCIVADGESIENGEGDGSESERTVQLSVMGVSSGGHSFKLDGNFVSWECSAAEGTASVDNDGRLTMDAESVGYVVGKLQVASSAWLSAAVSFKNMTPDTLILTTPADYALTCTRSTATTATVTLTNKTDTSSALRYVLAAYDGNGRMVTCGAADKVLGVSATTSLTLNYAAGSNVRTIRAYVLSSATSTPLRAVWTKTL